MEILKVVGLSFIAVTLIILFKNANRDDITLQICLAVGILIFIFMVPKLTLVIEFLKLLSDKAGINPTYLNLIFKILGIAYLTSFSAEICRDAGAGSIAGKIEFSGKILILSLSIPILTAILDSILKIL
ncbi:stage III sporulation protein AD [Hathewaya proteolytica DSM 3090]|uniref:Stage III sporulation protein AD n=1 Tax=Hathewaya proteolytica DSM 3090 TaxID=1121331 RepID=A0A1M6L5C0_9CLOT|nr:stage III sporulation protein AD [Hathewaya proteolytica]SHJ66393.1 stage III sporulation protein AD [Hathewaya proteolytica DSM 3090]